MPGESKTWDVAAVSQRFLSAAHQAELYLGEIRSKASTNLNYQLIHDQTLAEYYVYNYLHGRTCLRSRADLLAELNDMLECRRDEPPYEVFELERFVAHRRRTVEALIREFQGEA